LDRGFHYGSAPDSVVIGWNSGHAAVTLPDQHALILAGAGSGKTRVLTRRIAYLVGQLGVPPRQVLAVTHLPQVAACADQHWVVSKSLVDGNTLSTVTPVAGEHRVREIARMLGGVKITETTRQHAREMLA